MGDERYYPWAPSEDADWRLIAAAPSLLASAQAQDSLIADAQLILSRFLQPDQLTADAALPELLGLLDGPRQREVQAQSLSAILQATVGKA